MLIIKLKKMYKKTNVLKNIYLVNTYFYLYFILLEEASFDFIWGEGGGGDLAIYLRTISGGGGGGGGSGGGGINLIFMFNSSPNCLIA